MSAFTESVVEDTIRWTCAADSAGVGEVTTKVTTEVTTEVERLVAALSGQTERRTRALSRAASGATRKARSARFSKGRK